MSQVVNLTVEFPDEVLDAIKSSYEKYHPDLQASITEALESVKKLECYDDMVDMFVLSAVKNLVYMERHKVNKKIKEEVGYYRTRTSSVVNGTGETVNKVARSMYDYHLAGQSLGNIMGSRLQEISKQEKMTAEGHLFNHRLCEELIPLVEAERTVAQCVSHKRLRSIFQKIMKEKAHQSKV